jgi:hypothetical protein
MPIRLPAATILAGILLLSVRSAPASEPELILRLASGRQFTGTIDPKSNDTGIVLRSTRGGMTVRRPVAWDRIVAATVDGRAATVEELRTLAEGVGGRGPGDGGREAEVAELRKVENLAPVEPPLILPRMTAVSFDARIANWDADVETDGLIVDLLPMDADGYLAPVSGMVEIELFAPQRRVFHHAPLSGGDTLERVERWTRAIRAADFTANGVRLRLPFGAVHPEFDTDWLASHYGLVHVRLAAPGHGTFDASQDGLRIRPWAPNRDQLELKSIPRFLPTEAVGRHN